MEIPSLPAPAVTPLAAMTPPSWTTSAPLGEPTLTSPCVCPPVDFLLSPCCSTPLEAPAIEKARLPPLVRSSASLAAAAAAPLIATLDQLLVTTSTAAPDSLRVESVDEVFCVRGERRGSVAT